MYSYSEGLLRSGILEELRRQGSAKDSGIQIPKNHWVDIVHRLVYICIYLHEFWRHDLPSCRVAFACTCTGFALVSFFSTSRGDAERSPFGQLWKKCWYSRRKDLMLGWRPLKTLPPMGLPEKIMIFPCIFLSLSSQGLKARHRLYAVTTAVTYFMWQILRCSRRFCGIQWELPFIHTMLASVEKPEDTGLSSPLRGMGKKILQRFTKEREIWWLPSL